MTDTEMAISLGDYILRLRRKVEILRAIINDNGIINLDSTPWEDVAKLASNQDEIERLYSSQLNELRRTFPDHTPASAVIPALHNHFVGE